MKNRMLTIAGSAVMAAGIMFAQTGTSPTPSTPAPHAQRFHRGGMFRLGRRLNLTDAQSQQAKSIFQDMRTQAQPIRAQLKQSRQAIFNAVVSGQPADQIGQLAQAQAPQMAQLAALRAQAFQKFYATLTPAQQQQLQTMESHRASRGAAPAPTSSE
jgi:Spy/CpxP family protein refolding chaperone